jgi:hypothetical protein
MALFGRPANYPSDRESVKKFQDKSVQNWEPDLEERKN